MARAVDPEVSDRRYLLIDARAPKVQYAREYKKRKGTV